jgi:outer membrane protein assembly factor BamD (BamD/ComL family)
VVNAAVYYKRLIQAFPNSSMVEDAQKYLTQIEQASGTVVTDAADADNAIINQPLPESETSEEEGDDTAGEGEEGE